MRKLLSFLYGSTLMLAALSMVGLLVSVILTIVTRNLNIYVAGGDAYAGYFMAASGSLALADTLKRGEHVNVTLLINSMGLIGKRMWQAWAYAAGFLLAALFAFYSCKLVWQSYVYMDISVSNDATPLWMPQTFMALGAVVLAIALMDELVLELRGQRPTRSSTDIVHSE